MKKLSGRFKWLPLLIGFILIGLGVVTILLSANGEGEYDKNLFLIWSITLFVIAGLIILLDFLAFPDKPEFFDLVASGGCIGAGVFILVNQDIIRQVVSTLLPYVLISIGGVLVIKTVLLAIKRVSFKQWLLIFVVGVIILTSGIIFIVVKDMLKVIYIILGVLFITLGAVEIVGFITVISQDRHDKKVRAVAAKNEAKASRARASKKNERIKEQEEASGYIAQGDKPKEIVDATPQDEDNPDDDIKLIE